MPQWSAVITAEPRPLGYPDLLWLGGLASLLLLLMLWIRRSIYTGRDYFLAGRALPWWAVGTSLVATEFVPVWLSGLGASIGAYGLSALNVVWIGAIPLLVVGAFVLVPHYWRLGFWTVPELLERRFDASVRTTISLCWLLFLAAQLGVLLQVGATQLQGLLGLDADVAMLLLGAMMGTMVFAAGMGGVVYANTFVLPLLVLTCGVAGWTGLQQAGHWAELQQQVRSTVQGRGESWLAHDVGLGQVRQRGFDDAPDATSDAASGGRRLDPSSASAAKMQTSHPQRHFDEHFSLVQPVQSSTPWTWTTVLLALMCAVGPAGWLSHQSVLQPTMSARTAYDAQAAWIWVAALKSALPLLIVVPGLMALASATPASQLPLAVPKLTLELLPSGLRGVFAAAFVGGLLAALNAVLLTAVTLATQDFYLRWLRPQANDRQLLAAGHLSTIVLTIWGLVFGAILSWQSELVGQVFAALPMCIVPPTLVVVLLAVTTSRITASGALGGFLAGVLTSLALNGLSTASIAQWLGSTPLFRAVDAPLLVPLWACISTWLVAETVTYFAPHDQRGKEDCLLWPRQRRPLALPALEESR